MKYRVFISYRREDALFKDTVYNILSEYIDEERIFIDKKVLYNEPNEWAQSLKEALNTSEYIVICINKFTFVREPKDGKTDWYYEEIETALERQKKEGKIRIIPAINVRPEFDKTKFVALSKLQDVAYLSLGHEDFRSNLLKMVGIDVNTTQIKSTSTIQTVIKNISIPENLVLRRDMLNKLDNEFKKHQCVVINGIGGSGKTSLAYLYVKEQNFNNVAWVIVNDKIEDVFLDKIAGLLFPKEDYESFTRINEKPTKLDIIKSELSKIKGKNLLVFDINANNDEIKQEIETKIHNYLPSGTWKTLILTRVFAENQSRFATIKMDRMTADDAKELFTKNWTRTKIEFSQDQLAEITKELYAHPLLIEQTAIVFSKGHESKADEIISKIKENSKIDNSRTKIILSGLAIEDKEQQDIYTYLINLCNIEYLSNDDVKFLACYVTWPDEPIDYDVINTLLPNNDKQLESLVNKGIIARNSDDQYIIHSLMADVLREQISNEKIGYNQYFDSIKNILENDDRLFVIYKYAKFIVSSFIIYGICGDADLFVNFLYKLCDNNYSVSICLPIQECYNAINKMSITSNVTPFQLAWLSNLEGRIDELNNNFSKAKSCYIKALEILSNLEENSENKKIKIELYNNLALLEELHFCDFFSAQKYHKNAIEVEKKMKSSQDNLNGLSISLHNLANLEYKVGNFQSSKVHFEEAIKIKKGMPHTPINMDNLATYLYHFAQMEESRDNLKNAQEYYYEALDIKLKLHETPRILNDLIHMLINLAILEEKMGNYDLAKNHNEIALNKNLKILQLLENQHISSPEHMNSIASTIHNIAWLEEKLGNVDTAKIKYNNALKIRSCLPETPMYLDGLAGTLNSLANLENQLGDIISAREHYETTIDVYKKIPKSPIILYNLASAFHSLADVEDRHGNTELAKHYYEEALKIMWTLPQTSQNIDSLGTTLNNLAVLEENNNDIDAAKEHYEEAIKIKFNLPELPNYLESLSCSISNIASLEEKKGDFVSAKMYYEKALDVHRKLPQTSQNLDSLGTTLNKIAFLETKIGNMDSANKHYNEAIDVKKELPETPQYLNSLAITMYNLAELEEQLHYSIAAKKHYMEALQIYHNLKNEPMIKELKLKLVKYNSFFETLLFRIREFVFNRS